MTITLETPDTWPGSESPTNPSGERRNVLTVNGVEPDNDGNVVVTAGGNMPAALIVQALQTAYPRLTWLMSGNSTDGQPDTATAAAIDAFMTATGVTSDYVAFLDLGAAAASAGTLTIANAYSASSADNVVLVQSHGVLVIANAYSGSFADNVTLSNPSLLVLAIDDAYSGSFADAVTLAQSHGVLAIADAYSASFADTVTLAIAGGTLTIADAYSASSADNVVLTAGASGSTYTTGFDGATNGATTFDGWTASTSGTGGGSAIQTITGKTSAPAWNLGGGDGDTSGDGAMSRTMNVAAGDMTFWYKCDTGSLDAGTLHVYEGGVSKLTQALSGTYSNGTWYQFTVPVTAATGTTIMISISSLGGGGWIDDISIPIP